MKPILETVAQNFEDESNVSSLRINTEQGADGVFSTQCIIVNVDANAAQNNEITMEYSVTSYPTLKFFPRKDSPFATEPLELDISGKQLYSKYNKHPIAYEKSRTEEGFTNFLNEHCGTFRAVGGGLNEKAGHLTGVWDEWVGELMSFAGSVEEDGKARMSEIVGLMKMGLAEVKKEEEFAAKWYLKASEKIANGSHEWLDKESKRSVLLFIHFQMADG
jgi:protein disulfide-isomerase A6